MFTCFKGGVGHTLLGSHPWKTLSGCIQLDRNKFTCFLHSTDLSSTYIKDLNRVDFFSLGVSQHVVKRFNLDIGDLIGETPEGLPIIPLALT